MSKSAAEELFFDMWTEAHPDMAPVREYQFFAGRRWRFDFSWWAVAYSIEVGFCSGSEVKVALELEGLGRGRMGGHQTVKGMRSNCDKYNAAALSGWRVIRFLSCDVKRRFSEIEDVLLGAMTHGGRLPC